MEPQTKVSAKNVFLNLGAVVALYTLLVALVNLLFTVINTAYPQITNGYNYYGTQSISWPVATLIVFFPIFILLMWLLEKEYMVSPEAQSRGIHKWLTYITLFVAGITMAVDLIAVLYYFIDGQELTTGFLLKVLVLLVIAAAVFAYYLSDVRGKLTPKSRNIYRIVAFVIVFGSIIWGFSVIGSPRSQRLQKYDEQKVSTLSNISYEVTSFYSANGALPENLASMSGKYYAFQLDPQTQKSYEYQKTGTLTYNLCAEFNRSNLTSNSNAYSMPAWKHPAGRYCFPLNVNTNDFKLLR